MTFEWDEAKDEANFAKHGLRLSEFDGFDTLPIVIGDDRRTYGEARFRAFGRIGGRGYMIAYTIRDSAIRLISWRHCHDREIRLYEER
jgi:uncharacterized protein